MLRRLPDRRRLAAEQRRALDVFRRAFPGVPVIEQLLDRRTSGFQVLLPEQAQFLYASNALARIGAREVHDVASHRSWLLGLAAGLTVHTVDIRPPEAAAEHEVFHRGVAEDLPFESGTVDCVTSLSAIEHFGLGSYGDPLDPEADVKAAAEIVRVLRPGGHLVLTTLCTGRPEWYVVFNARRVYSLERVGELFRGLELVDGAFYSMRDRRFIDREALQTELAPQAHDIYLTTWRKPL